VDINNIATLQLNCLHRLGNKAEKQKYKKKMQNTERLLTQHAPERSRLQSASFVRLDLPS